MPNASNNTTPAPARQAPEELDAATLVEFCAGERKLTTREQAALRNECPLMWGLYFGPPIWMLSRECWNEVRLSTPFVAGLA